MGNEKGKSWVLKYSDVYCYMHILSAICFYFNYIFGENVLSLEEMKIMGVVRRQQGSREMKARANTVH